jgi:hypothetical protein
MENEAHLTVNVRPIEGVERLKAEKEHCNCSHVQTLGAESKELAAAAPSNAREVKEAQDKVLIDAFVISGVSITSSYQSYRSMLISTEGNVDGKENISLLHWCQASRHQAQSRRHASSIPRAI